MNACPKCLRENLTTETLNSGQDLCPATFLTSLGVHIDVGSCLKLENARLRSVVESRAARCEACGGGGYVVKVSGKVGQPLNRERIPCPACSDLREALAPKVSVG